MLGFAPISARPISGGDTVIAGVVLFPFYLLPSPSNTQFTTTLRQVVNKFGDGYRQQFGDGPSPVDRTHTLSWDPIDSANAQAICTFLDNHVGVPFLYRLPREQVARRWVWTGRQRSYPYPGQDALSVTLEERFVP